MTVELHAVETLMIVVYTFAISVNVIVTCKGMPSSMKNIIQSYHLLESYRTVVC